MTCRDFIDFLSDYLSGALEPEERAIFDAHLAECPSCVAYLKTYEQAIRLGKEALSDSGDRVPPEVPKELLEAILAAREDADRP